MLKWWIAVVRQGFMVFGFLSIGWLASACAPEMSPWSVALDDRHQNLTQKNLEWLARLDPGEARQGPLHFAIIGDPQGTPADFQKTIQQLNKRQDLAFILVLGDMTDFGLKHEFEWAADAILQSNIPVLTVIGNHDAIASGQRLYKRMFGPLDYTFSFGGYKFVMWNNNLYEFGDPNFSWLSAVIDDRSIVSSHVPPVVDMHSQQQVEQWTVMQSEANIVGSLHGHRGGTRSFFWNVEDVPYYVVARNRGERWARVTVDEGLGMQIEYCQELCRAEVAP